MKLNNDNEKPLFLQFAESLEDDILKGIFPEESQVPSTTEAAIRLKINPATANRGVNLLVEEGIIYKKRGIGMFVCTGAREKIAARRRQAIILDFVEPLVEESGKLGLSGEEIIEMIKRGFKNERD